MRFLLIPADLLQPRPGAAVLRGPLTPLPGATLHRL